LIGFSKVRLYPSRRASAPAIAHRLVLKWAFAAFIADWAIQWMVAEKKLHDTFLRLIGNR
jgi:hypothetical protein